MDLTDKNKAHIDAMSYEGLLSEWRFVPVGSPWFQGETGEYWAKRMKELRDKPGGKKTMWQHQNPSAGENNMSGPFLKGYDAWKLRTPKENEDCGQSIPRDPFHNPHRHWTEPDPDAQRQEQIDRIIEHDRQREAEEVTKQCSVCVRFAVEECLLCSRPFCEKHIGDHRRCQAGKTQEA